MKIFKKTITESTCCNGGTPKAPKPPKEKKVKPVKPKKGELIDKDSKEPKGVAAAKELAKATKSAPFQVKHKTISNCSFLCYFPHLIYVA